MALAQDVTPLPDGQALPHSVSAASPPAASPLQVLVTLAKRQDDLAAKNFERYFTTPDLAQAAGVAGTLVVGEVFTCGVA